MIMSLESVLLSLSQIERPNLVTSISETYFMFSPSSSQIEYSGQILQYF